MVRAVLADQILFYGINDNELDDSGLVATGFINAPINAKAGTLSGGMRSQYNRPKGYKDPAVARRRTAEAQVKLWQKQRAQEDDEVQRQKLAALTEQHQK